MTCAGGEFGQSFELFLFQTLFEVGFESGQFRQSRDELRKILRCKAWRDEPPLPGLLRQAPCRIFLDD